MYIDEKHDITKPSSTLQTVIVWNQWKMCDNEQETRETQKTPENYVHGCKLCKSDKGISYRSYWGQYRHPSDMK